jgi:hypothetical protein
MSSSLRERDRKELEMWDVLSWHDGTLAVAWWALLLVTILVVIHAGSAGRH